MIKIILIVIGCWFVVSCATHQRHSSNQVLSQPVEQLLVQLYDYPNSDFKQVTARFTTPKSKELVIRVLSSLEHTSQWLEEVASIETLVMVSHSEFVLRTVLNSPWPFKQRELISCVTTNFEPQVTTINIESCSDRLALNEQFVRITDLKSRWVITATSKSSVVVNYQTWLDPAGAVPAFFFNLQLEKTTVKSLNRLQKVIEQASLDQYY